MSVFLSIIIPAYNERDRLPKTLRDVSRYLSNAQFTSEVIVVNDGSQDKTEGVAREEGSKIKNFKVIGDTKNHGKGWAVREGMKVAEGEWRLFMDADNSTTIDQFENFLPLYLVYAQNSCVN